MTTPRPATAAGRGVGMSPRFIDRLLSSLTFLKGEPFSLSLGQPLVQIRHGFGHDDARAGILRSLDVTFAEVLRRIVQNMDALFIFVHHERPKSRWHFFVLFG